MKTRYMNKHVPAMAREEYPSTKILMNGHNSMTDSELLSLIIGSGIHGESSLDIARTILGSCNNNLCELWRLGYSDLLKFKGIGERKAVQILGLFALSRRRNQSESLSRQKISSSRNAWEIMHPILGDLAYEEFWILIMNRANKVIRTVKISEGGVSGTVVDPKKVFKIALDNHASAMILAHNHPSGLVNPSDADISLTKKIVDLGRMMEISVLDHLIIGSDMYYSFADEGKI